MPEQDRSYFARLSRDLMHEGAELPTLQAVVKRALDVVPGCDMAGISLRRRRGRVSTVAATHDEVEACDALQYELDEGPCLAAIWHGDGYVSNDLSRDLRWPVWGPRVAERGMGSIIALRIADATNAIGALNLYASSTGAYDAHAYDVAMTYGFHAANAMVSAKQVDGLQSSIESRHTIGLAQGILMKTYDLSIEQSFTVLQRYSSRFNVRLRDLAARIVEDRRLPDDGAMERTDVPAPRLDRSQPAAE